MVSWGRVASPRQVDVAAPDGPDVALMGTWTWRINAASLDWFVSQVLPLLPAHTSVAVAGAGADHLRGRYPNVTICGRVDDGSAFLRSARVVAVPSTARAGVQIKTLDAIASGRPVVPSSLPMRGIEHPPPTTHVPQAPDASPRLR